MTTITDAHRDEEQGMTTDTDASVNYLRTALAETDRIASDLQTLCDKQATELDRLRAENERLATDHQSYCKSWDMRKQMNSLRAVIELHEDKAVQCNAYLAKLQADLSEERHAHNKTQFDLAEARKERALIVAIVRDVVNSFQDEDGYELAGQVRIRLKQIERGEHLGGQHEA